MTLRITFSAEDDSGQVYSTSFETRTHKGVSGEMSIHTDRRDLEMLIRMLKSLSRAASGDKK